MKKFAISLSVAILAIASLGARATGEEHHANPNAAAWSNTSANISGDAGFWGRGQSAFNVEVLGGGYSRSNDLNAGTYLQGEIKGTSAGNGSGHVGGTMREYASATQQEHYSSASSGSLLETWARGVGNVSTSTSGGIQTGAFASHGLFGGGKGIQ